MTYRIVLTRPAEKEFLRLSDDLSARVTRTFRELQQNPRPMGVKKLEQRPGYRVRVGEYRIVYAIDDAARCVTVLAIRHRREAYRCRPAQIERPDGHF